MMRMLMFKVGSVRSRSRGREIRGPEGPDGGGPLPRRRQHLHLQAVEGGRPQTGHREHVVIRGQDLGLRDDAVGKAVLPALGGDLRPGHLEAGHGLVEGGLGHLPREVSCDAHVLDHEGGGEVLGLGLYSGVNVTCFSRAADVLVAFALKGGARRRSEENGFCLQAALWPCGLHGHLIFAGK